MLRRGIPRRATAALATGLLAAAGAVVLSAPAAQAAEVSWTSKCKNKIATWIDIPPSETKVDISVEPVKATYKVGDQVTVHWKWKSYSIVPDTGFVTQIDKDSTKPTGILTLSGAESGDFNVEGPRVNPVAPVGQPLVVSDMTGTLTLSKAGTLDLTPKQYSTFTMVGTLDAETECTPLPVGTVPPKALSLTVEPPTSEPPAINAPDGELHPGEEVALTGSRFPSKASPVTAALCKADVTECDPSKLTGNTLAIDEQGNLSGKVKLHTTIPDGQYAIRVQAGGGTASDVVTIKNAVASDRKIQLSTSSGPVGTKVTVTGSGFNPNKTLLARTLLANDYGVGTMVTVKSSPTGTFTTVLTISSPDVAKIRVSEGTDFANAPVEPFTVTPGAVGYQTVTVGLTAGGLTMAQAGTGINFGTATLNGQVQTLNANLNQVTVVDARGGNAGWSLVGNMSDLTSASGGTTIPAGKIAWTPACAKSDSSLSNVVTGSAGPLANTASTLCSQDANPAAATGGRFTADAAMTLTTPEFAAAGSYTGTLTLTLS